jgi:hypothetical protein
VDLARVLLVVRVAADAKVLGGDGLPGFEAIDVVELGLEGRAADAAAFHRPLALALVALPDRAADLGGDVSSVEAEPRGVLRRPRLRDEGLLLGVLGEEELQAFLEDRHGVGAGHGVGDGVLAGVEQLQELRRDREVQTAVLGGEGLDDGAGRRCGGPGNRWR